MSKKILLYGGGGHNWRDFCPILEGYLNELADVDVDYRCEDQSVLHADALAPYDLVVMANTGGQLEVEAKRGLVESIAAGKSFLGIHGAADSFHNSPEYEAMVGGVFRGHPFVREYTVCIADKEHPITRDFEGYGVKDWEMWPCYEYKVTDEQYLLDWDSRVRVLATTVYSGHLPRQFPKGHLWPVAWVKDWGKGHVFYMALGHDVPAVQNAFFKSLFQSGARWLLEPTEPA